jgi:hypothetical protein
MHRRIRCLQIEEEDKLVILNVSETVSPIGSEFSDLAPDLEHLDKI